jgi:RNA polymerase-binding protein DksA
MKLRPTKHGVTGRHPVRRKARSTALAVLGPEIGRTGPDKSTNSKWAWHCRALLALRDRLLEARAERRNEAAQPLEPHSMDIADSATDEFDHDFALSELSAEQDALYEVDEALKRILNGTYGVCEETGQPIPLARLRAVPWTRFGKEAQTRLEGKSTVSKSCLGASGAVGATLTGDESLRKIPTPPVEAERERVVPSRQRSRGGRARKRGSHAKSRQRR